MTENVTDDVVNSTSMLQTLSTEGNAVSRFHALNLYINRLGNTSHQAGFIVPSVIHSSIQKNH